MWKCLIPLLISVEANEPTEFSHENVVTLTAEQENFAFEVGKLLRCPVCQGMPVAESPADSARSMMQRVRMLVADGKNAMQIKDFFVERYGEWVLLEPTPQGINFWVWGLPPLVLVIGILFMLYAFRRGKKRTSQMTPAPTALANDKALDPYLRRIRDELAD